MNWLRIRLAISAIVFFTVCALWAQHSATPAAEGTAKTAEQQFKNIQVLKGVPADQIIPAMQFISSSLGVECEFCHVRNAFDKDDKKPKQVARKMMQMQMAIDKENFNGENAVTCFSCHRGAENPVGIPIISAAAEAPKSPEAENQAAAQPALPSADEILNKYLQAVGGAAAVEKITSRKEDGMVSFGRQQFPVEVFAKAPNKRISFVHTPNGDNVTAFDGNNGWLGNPGPRPPRDMTAQENEAASFDATFYLPSELKKIFTQFKVRPSEKIDGKNVVQVIGMNPGHPPTRLFFDQESGLLVRSVRYATTPVGLNPTEVDYADYREETGVKIPMQWTVARPNGRFTIQISKVEQNVPIADSKFEKPAASAQKPGTK
ncbi:MAG TPA: c-type cytochrome [Candidatus Angelobacter sp.]|jgi:photosynthetic reaction center cytochrome c subunit|nr:c-type cytochrome [Candidatus Angelobacter sp.]